MDERASLLRREAILWFSLALEAFIVLEVVVGMLHGHDSVGLDLFFLVLIVLVASRMAMRLRAYRDRLNELDSSET